MNFLLLLQNHPDITLKMIWHWKLSKRSYQGIEIVYPTQESMAIFLDLMNRYHPKGLKVHVFEIISIGLAHGIHEVATFNSKDFKSVKEITLTEI